MLLDQNRPCKIHTVLTDNRVHRELALRGGNGIRFAVHPKPDRADRPVPRPPIQPRPPEPDIERRLIKPNHPWTNGQVERVNRTIKDATVSRHHDESHEQIREHLDDFILASDFARRLKTLKGLTPCEFPCETFLAKPERFRLDPTYVTPESYS